MCGHGDEEDVDEENEAERGRNRRNKKLSHHQGVRTKQNNKKQVIRRNASQKYMVLETRLSEYLHTKLEFKTP